MGEIFLHETEKGTFSIVQSLGYWVVSFQTEDSNEELGRGYGTAEDALAALIGGDAFPTSITFEEWRDLVPDDISQWTNRTLLSVS